MVHIDWRSVANIVGGIAATLAAAIGTVIAP